MSSTVLAAHNWHTNAELIADVARLGYLKKSDVTLDPTYGRGNWWTKWRPDQLVEHDVGLDGVLFTDLPEDDDTFDAVAFDPPYVSTGGRDTTGMPEFFDRYGMTNAPRTPAGVQELINKGLDEIARVVKPKGKVLVKCANYISSGKLWTGTYYTQQHAFGLGWKLVDLFEHIGSPRPQPSGRRQVHARRNLSTLLVFGVPR